MHKPKHMVSVDILSRRYDVICEPHERDAVLDAARYLSNSIRTIKASARSADHDKAVVMTALNLAHELLASKKLENTLEQTKDRLVGLQERILNAIQDADDQLALECEQADSMLAMEPALEYEQVQEHHDASVTLAVEQDEETDEMLTMEQVLEYEEADEMRSMDHQAD